MVSPRATGVLPAQWDETLSSISPTLCCYSACSMGLSLPPGLFFPGHAASLLTLPQPGLPLSGPINLLCLMQSPDVSSQFSFLHCSVPLPSAPLTALLPGPCLPPDLLSSGWLAACWLSSPPGTCHLRLFVREMRQAGPRGAVCAVWWLYSALLGPEGAGRQAMPQAQSCCLPMFWSSNASLSPLLRGPCTQSLPFPAQLGVMLGSLLCSGGGNEPFTSPTWDQSDPARKPLLKFLCSPCDGASPVAVYSPLICLFSGPQGTIVLCWGFVGPFPAPKPTQPLCLLKQCVQKDGPRAASVWVPRAPQCIPNLCSHLYLLPDQCFHVSSWFLHQQTTRGEPCAPQGIGAFCRLVTNEGKCHNSPKPLVLQTHPSSH